MYSYIYIHVHISLYMCVCKRFFVRLTALIRVMFRIEGCSNRWRMDHVFEDEKKPLKFNCWISKMAMFETRHLLQGPSFWGIHSSNFLCWVYFSHWILPVIAMLYWKGFAKCLWVVVSNIFMFIPTWGDEPISLIFFKRVVQPPTRSLFLKILEGSTN